MKRQIIYVERDRDHHHYHKPKVVYRDNPSLPAPSYHSTNNSDDGFPLWFGTIAISFVIVFVIFLFFPTVPGDSDDVLKSVVIKFVVSIPLALIIGTVWYVILRVID